MQKKKKNDKQHFKGNFVMSADNEQRFQSSNKCWICHILFNVGVRDHCYVTDKYRGSAHWSSSINFKLTKNVPVIFHNLKRYDSHLIMQKIGKLDVKVIVIPNALEEQMAFTKNK